ncbi:uncharacterized protein P884DRAFT_265162 [Thermothelomyces heterothallicus CBS 202.75]|uniref:uncharacterized protein n=1 Tax=Thermothelomyces heterothallicus CBS 202.75 TaxID=1149848 RepID=UPI003744086C
MPIPGRLTSDVPNPQRGADDTGDAGLTLHIRWGLPERVAPWTSWTAPWHVRTQYGQAYAAHSKQRVPRPPDDDNPPLRVPQRADRAVTTALSTH